jgi:hypothetical protein
VRTAHSFKFAAFQQAKQFALNSERSERDFVQEKYAFICHLKLAGFLNFIPASEYVWPQAILTQRRAVNRDETFVPPGAYTMHGSSDQLLTRSRFPEDQHGSVGTSHFHCQLKHLFELRRVAYDFIQAGF